MKLADFNKIFFFSGLIFSQALLASPFTGSKQHRLPEPPLIEITDLAGKAQMAKAKPYVPGQPDRFAVSGPVADSKGFARNWAEAGDRLVSRLVIHSAEAKNINLAFEPFFLPHGAELHLRSEKTGQWLPAYTDRHNNRFGQLWTPIIEGERVLLEISVPKEMATFVELGIKSVQHGFIDPADNQRSKAGSCNVDTVCEEGNAWQNEAAAVALYLFEGSYACTGTLINNTAENEEAYFLTANHCLSTQAPAETTVFYWGYESNSCRAVGSSQNGNTAPNNASTSNGADLVATNGDTDFTLLRLASNPANVADVTWAGWDRRDMTHDAGIGIHHPQGDAKRISFDFDPLTLASGIDAGTAAGGSDLLFLRVNDWDLGTTEKGSSGSGLWNANHHLIGQLFGGLAACGNNNPDWYGRLSQSWSRGQTAASRLKDWLDPANTGATTLDGKSACTPPSVTLSSTSNPARAGELVMLQAQASGGSGSYSYTWDVDGDGISDGQNEIIEAQYPRGGNYTVSVTVTDQSGCSARESYGLSVNAPAFTLSQGNASQVCGDNDGRIEPGETWRIPVTIKNTSTHNASNVAAVFSKQGGEQLLFKSQAKTYREQNSCSYQALDISSTGDALVFEATSPGFPENDEGFAPVSLAAGGMQIDGSQVNTLQVSSNGFIAFGEEEASSDWSWSCPLPDAEGDKRLVPFHSDLVTGAAYYQYFSSCPVNSSNGACHVIQWSDTGYYTEDNSGGSFSFQAILYPQTEGIVYQYFDNIPNGEFSTTGIQYNSDSGLTYACDTAGSIQNNSAVCFEKVDSTGLALKTPAIELGSINASGSKQGNLDIHLASTASCGGSYSINLEAVIFDGGHSAPVDNAIELQVASSQCAPVNSCSNNDDFLPLNGLWNNDGRTGHGIDLFVVNGDTIFTAWYTARADHSPIWYTMSNRLNGKQVHGPLYELSWDKDTNTSSSMPVGELLMSFSNDKEGYLSWQIGDKRGSEPFNLYFNQPVIPANNYSGMWFNPAQSGWGITFNSKGETNFSLIYAYDDNGAASWTLGVTENNNGGSIDMLYAKTTCPWCAWVPLSFEDAGNIQLQFSSQTEGEVDMDLYNTSKAWPLLWQRNNLPMQMISEPE